MEAVTGVRLILLMILLLLVALRVRSHVLLRVSPPCFELGVATGLVSLDQWLVYPNQLVDQVIEALLIFGILAQLRVVRVLAVEVLGEYRFEILVQLLLLMVLRKMLFVISNQFLYLFLQLFV